MKRFFTLCLLLASGLLLAPAAQAQTWGEYRTTSSANSVAVDWTNPTAWEVYVGGGSWVATTVPPTSSTPRATLRTNVNISTDVQVPNTIVNAVRTLTVTSTGTLTIAANLFVYGSGRFTLASGGTLKVANFRGIYKTQFDGAVQTTGPRLYSSGGNYHFNGSTLQTTGNGLPSDSVYSLTINNPAGFNLNDSVKIYGSLNLIQGVLSTTAGNEITLLENATLNGGSATSYVEGPFRQAYRSAATVTKTIPIGNDYGYRPVTHSISHSGNGLCIYQFQVISPTVAASNFDSTVEYVTQDRYWKVTPIRKNANILQCDYTFLWDVNDNYAIIQPDVNEIVIANYSSIWSKVTNPLTKIGSSSSGTISFTDNSYATHSFAIAMEHLPPSLPVELVAFSASLNDNAAYLSWTTAAEINNDRFEIERSLDGKHFLQIGAINGKGTVQQSTVYGYTDPEALKLGANALYYRLKQVDHNGKFEYSPIRLLRIKNGPLAGNDHILLYPNPAKEGKIFLRRVDPMGLGSATVDVYNSAGARVLSQGIQWDGLETSLSMPKLPSGLYHVKIIQDGQAQSLRLLMK